MNEKLKPCPFCGSNSIRIWDGNHYWCQCNVCLASTAAEDTREEAVELWNKRTNDLDRVVEQLKDLKPYKLDLADAMMDTLENGKYRHFVCLEEVLNIVKAGGIDDSQT